MLRLLVDRDFNWDSDGFLWDEMKYSKLQYIIVDFS